MRSVLKILALAVTVSAFYLLGGCAVDAASYSYDPYYYGYYDDGYYYHNRPVGHYYYHSRDPYYFRHSPYYHDRSAVHVDVHRDGRHDVVHGDVRGDVRVHARD